MPNALEIVAFVGISSLRVPVFAGRCDYCNTDGVGVIEPRELALYSSYL